MLWIFLIKEIKFSWNLVIKKNRNLPHYDHIICIINISLHLITFEWIDWVKHIALPNERGLHPISWRPKYNKKTDSFELGPQLFPDFGVRMKHQYFLGLKPPGLWNGATPSALLAFRPSDSDWNCIVGCPGLPAY